jgi:uncharacterized protein (DUF1501 family)
MSDYRMLFTRREFMRNMALASVGISALPAFLGETAQAALAGATASQLRDQPILVVIQLGGGNDGLNTVVPFGNDIYHQARRNLALKKDELIPLSGELSLHSALAPVKGLYDDGRVSVINGVGYPNPNRSHFRSMEIWHTATDADRFSRTGWIGRYFDNACQGAPAETGVNVGAEMPAAFMSKGGVGVSFVEPERFAWREGKGGNKRPAFDRMNGLGAAAPGGVSNLDYLRQVTAGAVQASDSVLRAARRAKSSTTYPEHTLGRSLKSIAELIAGGLSTRIYYTSMTGFDTHANQSFQHRNLLGIFANSLAAFMKDLDRVGMSDRVMVMAFSEFGRRVAVNGSGGTDHGTAGPVFLAGAGIKPGVHGAYPRLDDLDNGDLRHTVDFRSVYTEILQAWMGVDPKPILGREFAPINVVERGKG